MNERVTQLLRVAAPDRPPVRFEDVRRRVRHRRRTRAAVTAVVMAAVIAAVVVPLTLTRSTGASDTITAAPTAPTASFRNVSFALPAGWHITRNTCAVVPRTVFAGPLCEGQPPPTAPIVEIVPNTALTPYFETHIERLACTVRARSVLIDGYRGQLDSGCESGPTKTGYTTAGISTFLQFDLLDARVYLSAGNPTQLQYLLDRLSIRPAASLQVPASAPSLTVTSVLPSTPPPGPGGIFTDHPKIAAVLDALRSAPLLPISTPLCLDPKAQLITPVGGRDYTVSFGTCNQIVTGNGTLARATPQLQAAVEAILGTSTPEPTTTPAGCAAQQLKITYSKSGVFGGGNAGYILTVENTGPQPCSLSNKVQISGESANVSLAGSQEPSGPRQRLDTTIVKQQPPQLTVLPGEDATFAIQDNDRCPGGAQGYDHLQITLPGKGTVEPPTDAYVAGCPLIVHTWQIGQTPDLGDNLPLPSTASTPAG